MGHIVVTFRVGYARECNSFVEGCERLQHVIDECDLAKLSDAKARSPRQTELLSITDDQNSVDTISGNCTLRMPIDDSAGQLGISYILANVLYVSAYSFVRHLEIVGLELAPSLSAKFPGPRFGPLAVHPEAHKRPLFGAILKPRGAINPQTALRFIAELAEGGIDFIVDDELTVDPESWPFRARAQRIVETIAKHSRAATKPSYIANVTADYESALTLAQFAHESGVGGVMVNAITMGYDVIRTLSSRVTADFKPFIMTNVIGRSMLTRPTDFRIADHVFGLLARLAGSEVVHVGAPAGTLESKHNRFINMRRSLQDAVPGTTIHTSVAAMSGGLDFRNCFANYSVYGGPCILTMGGSLLRMVNSSYRPKLTGGDLVEVFRKLWELFERHPKDYEHEVMNSRDPRLQAAIRATRQ